MDVIDHRAIGRDGRAYTVLILPDNDALLSDADCYTLADCHAYAVGDWRFVGLVVTRDDGAESSVWGVEYGTAPDWPQALDLDYLISEDNYVSALIREISERQA